MRLNKRKLLLFLISVTTIIPLAGCWDSEEIDQRAVVLAIALDKADEEGDLKIAHEERKFDKPNLPLVRLSAQIAVPGRIPLGPQTGGGGGADQSPVWVVNVTGHTIDEAILNLQQKVADELFLGHLRVIVVSEKLARGGVNRFNDYLKRNPQVRRTAWMVVSKGNAEKFMKIAPKLERVPALYLSTIVDEAVDLGKLPRDFIGKFWSILSSNAQDAFLPYLVVKNNENVQVQGLAYFNGDKMEGVTSPVEIGVFMGIIGENKGGYGAFIKIQELPGIVLVRAMKRQTKIKVSLKNGNPHVRINYHYECEIDENEKELNKRRPLSPSVINSISEKFNKGIEKTTKRLIVKTQEQHSDIFGFGEHFRAKEPEYWKKNVKNLDSWHDEFAELTVEVNCKTDIRRVGMKAK